METPRLRAISGQDTIITRTPTSPGQASRMPVQSDFFHVNQLTNNRLQEITQKAKSFRFSPLSYGFPVWLHRPSELPAESCGAGHSLACGAGRCRSRSCPTSYPSSRIHSTVSGSTWSLRSAQRALFDQAFLISSMRIMIRNLDDAAAYVPSAAKVGSLRSNTSRPATGRRAPSPI